MNWLETRADLRAGRLDDERLLAEARSVVVLAASYDHPVRPPAPDSGGGRGDTAASDPTGERCSADLSPPPPPELGAGGRTVQTGTIARYARGAEDYHTVLRDMLNDLSGKVESAFPGSRCRGFVDSGPLRERELAARAGMGWQGKHTNLISLDLGNFFFLAALLTTLELTPDEPFAGSHCGTCTRCLTACPTGAIIAPMVLDARRCISYLTIEHRGPIPLELRSLMGDRIFGCDDCLAACPWNEKAQAGSQARLAGRDGEHANPDLLRLLADLETETGFRARFRGTPLLRPKREGLRRNVCIALGNVGNHDATTPLEVVAASDSSGVVREAATWAVSQIRTRFSSPDAIY
ncbi:MAG: tRNA epoxyqueuosine(34) reductase QueG [Akkermansiaceae bacterium]|nr:tRNA epoxyqueuosine(34) reductase QueG [Armatimonadota bacterium]